MPWLNDIMVATFTHVQTGSPTNHRPKSVRRWTLYLEFDPTGNKVDRYGRPCLPRSSGSIERSSPGAAVTRYAFAYLDEFHQVKRSAREAVQSRMVGMVKAASG